MERYENSEKNRPYQKGVIKEVDHDKRRAKVQLQDEDDNQSFWLRLPTRGGKDNVEVDDYAEEELVDVLVDWDGEDGVIIGGSFNEKDTPPWTDKNKRGRKYSDGAELTHNTETHTTEATAANVNLGPDGRTPSSGVGHLVHVTFGSSMGMHPIATGSPSVNIKD